MFLLSLPAAGNNACAWTTRAAAGSPLTQTPEEGCYQHRTQAYHAGSDEEAGQLKTRPVLPPYYLNIEETVSLSRAGRKYLSQAFPTLPAYLAAVRERDRKNPTLYRLLSIAILDESERHPDSAIFQELTS